MLGDGIDVNVLKYGIICILSLLAFIIVFIFKLIFGSYIIGVIAFVVMVWLIVFKIGITIMYPGSSNYFTSDIEIRIGSELAKNLHHLGHCFQFIA
jgi:c-di-AMP phosphodiesterase-like protein